MLFDDSLLVLGILAMAYAANVKARFFIRCTLLYITMMANVFLSMVVCLPASLFWHASTVVFALLKFLTKWTGINFDTRNYDAVFGKQTTSCVVICNHQSALDIIVMAHAWPPRGTVMMKRSLAYVPFFNILSWLCNVIFVDRQTGDKSKKSDERSTMNKDAVKQCTQVVEKNLKLWIYPEGTRNRSLDGMLPFKKGAFNVAVQAQIAIVPIVASSYKSFYSHNDQYFDSDGEVIIEVMEPIPTTGLSLNDVPALADEVRAKMLVVYERITAEANQKMALKRGEKMKK